MFFFSLILEFVIDKNLKRCQDLKISYLLQYCKFNLLGLYSFNFGRYTIMFYDKVLFGPLYPPRGCIASFLDYVAKLFIISDWSNCSCSQASYLVSSAEIYDNIFLCIGNWPMSYWTARNVFIAIWTFSICTSIWYNTASYCASMNISVNQGVLPFYNVRASFFLFLSLLVTQ